MVAHWRNGWDGQVGAHAKENDEPVCRKRHCSKTSCKYHAYAEPAAPAAAEGQALMRRPAGATALR